MTRPIDRRTRATFTGATSILLLLSVSVALATPARNAIAAVPPVGQLMAQAAPPPASSSAPAPAPSVAGQRLERPGPDALVAGRIDDLHKKLRITAEQEPAFKVFADAMRANAQSMHALFQLRAQNTDRTAIGMLRWHAQLAQAQADAMNKLVAAFDPLYQSMSAEQKRAADAAFQKLRVRRAPRTGKQVK